MSKKELDPTTSGYVSPSQLQKEQQEAINRIHSLT
jgi:hypothetical protein